MDTESRSNTGSPSSLCPGIVSNIHHRLSKSSHPVSRGRDYDFEGDLGESPRSGSRFLQPPLPGGKGVRRLETRDRPLSFQRVHTTTPFKMETASSVLLSVRKGDFLASIDLKDAYFQIPVHTYSRKWLRFGRDSSSV